MKIPAMNWAVMSIAGMICIIPSWIGIPFFEKTFGVRPEIFMIWYFLGVIAGSSLYLNYGGVPLVPSLSALMLAVAIGLTFGAAANMLLFAATAAAPNPGLPSAIASSASVFVFALGLILFRLYPANFNEVRFDGYHLMGIFIVIAGIVLMVKPR